MIRITLCSVFVSFGLAGCSPKNLYVAHETVVGVNAKVSADRQQGQLVVGYDRDFITVVPTSVTVKDENGDLRQEAMSLVSCSELEVDGIFLSGYSDVTATGAAARQLGKAIEANEAVLDCSGGGS